NGNYIVVSPLWANGTVMDAGAVTFGDGVSGVSGTISTANSLIVGSGSTSRFAVADEVNKAFYVSFSGNGGERVIVGSQIDGFAHQWHLAARPLDVDNDSHVAPGDALAIINYINAGLPTAIGPNSQIGQPYGFLDVTGDDNVAP